LRKKAALNYVFVFSVMNSFHFTVFVNDQQSIKLIM